MIRFCCVLAISAIALLPAGQALAQTATPVSVTLSNYAFTPGELDLKAGTTYQIHFVNSGSKGHNFSAPQFFAASQVAPEDQGKVVKGLVELDEGKSVDVTVTPSRAGTFPVECTHFMHKSMGMHGTIVVQ